MEEEVVEAAGVELEPLVEFGVQGDHLGLELKQCKSYNFKWIKTTKVFTSRVQFYVFCKNANTFQANVLCMPNVKYNKKILQLFFHSFK